MNNNEQHNRGQLTLIRLEQALDRLLKGVPERTVNDGRISLSRVNNEAGLSSGGIYYYKEFIENTKSIIQNRKQANTIEGSPLNDSTEKKLRLQRDKEKQLKEHYRQQRNDIKSFCDKVVEKNAQLEFALFEALEKIDAIEHELSSIKVIDIGRKNRK